MPLRVIDRQSSLRRQLPSGCRERLFSIQFVPSPVAVNELTSIFGPLVLSFFSPTVSCSAEPSGKHDVGDEPDGEHPGVRGSEAGHLGPTEGRQDLSAGTLHGELRAGDIACPGRSADRLHSRRRRRRTVLREGDGGEDHSDRRGKRGKTER